MDEGDVTIGEYLIAGATDLKQRVDKLDRQRDADDLDYWLEERELVRTAVRMLRQVDDELTFKLTGERVLHGQYYDEQRRAMARAREVDAEIAETVGRHPAGTVWQGRTVLDVSLPESDAEAEQRRFTER